jgi:hypothetical protein
MFAPGAPPGGAVGVRLTEAGTEIVSKPPVTVNVVVVSPLSTAFAVPTEIVAKASAPANEAPRILRILKLVLPPMT